MKLYNAPEGKVILDEITITVKIPIHVCTKLTCWGFGKNALDIVEQTIDRYYKDNRQTYREFLSSKSKELDTDVAEQMTML